MLGVQKANSFIELMLGESLVRLTDTPDQELQPL